VIALRDAGDRMRCGGKAAHLAALIAAGLPVPDGVVIPADLPPSRLAAAVEQALAWASPHSARGLIARSSCPAEDSAAASFAGLYLSQFTAAARTVTPCETMAVLVQPALRPHVAGVLMADAAAGALEGGRLRPSAASPGRSPSGSRPASFTIVIAPINPGRRGKR
jgi:pyruvate, water dikinase